MGRPSNEQISSPVTTGNHSNKPIKTIRVSNLDCGLLGLFCISVHEYSGEICYLQLQGTSELFKTEDKTACSPKTLLTTYETTQSQSPENHVNFHTYVI
jgi:hypothetical protein